MFEVVVDLEISDEVVEWLSSLTDEDRERAILYLGHLSRLGHTARPPLSRALGDGLFELRFTLAGTARRITYRFAPGSRAVILTTFRKQRQNERVEITRARAASAAWAKQHLEEN